MNFFDKLFGGSANEAALTALKEGGIVIDVRTPAEYSGGHVAGSKNIPLNEIPNRAKEIAGMKKPIVLCCRSGNRSGQATQFLQAAGVSCVNGGTWQQVNALTAKL